jgi:hypothetical protein
MLIAVVAVSVCVLIFVCGTVALPPGVVVSRHTCRNVRDLRSVRNRLFASVVLGNARHPGSSQFPRQTDPRALARNIPSIQSAFIPSAPGWA